MNQQNVYPLKQVIEVKKKRVEDAEKVVQEKKLLLQKEQEKLAQREADRDKVKNHRTDKLQQLRDTLDHAMTSPKVQQMKVYLKIVDEKLKVEEKKVKDQQEQVNIATKNLDQAKEDLRKKRQDVDKLQTHQIDWEKEMRKELQIQEGREQDELGNTIYIANQAKKGGNQLGF